MPSKTLIRNLIIILVVLVAAILIDLPGERTIPLINKTVKTNLGLDLVGGVQALLEADLPASQAIPAESMQTTVRIVENRVNGLGVSEAVVQQAGERRIVVELPGETDPEQALAALRQTGHLEFVDFSGLSEFEVAALIDQTIKTDFAQPEDSEEGDEATGDQRVFHTIMTGTELRDVGVATDNVGNFVVDFSLTPEGSRIFSDYTSRHVGSYLAIVLDGRVISAPAINEPITGGAGMISGNFTYETANALAVQLRYGSLPIPLKVVETRTVNPRLGADSLQKSLIAGAIGFSIVILFMALYYRLPGIIADLVILMYAAIAFALFRYIPVTLTLPGIAGFLLSTGSALDANILIFERLKEELRAGRTIRQALDLGWKRAWPSIRDSNIATLITCAILFWFGSSFGATIVKGFSLTLALGVGVSLFTALFVTRTLLGLVLQLFQPEDEARWFGI
jgi:preprotein translocase subunit SecD